MNNDVVNTYNELLKRLSDTGKALENNAQLYDSEIITKEEFETKKSNIFNKENIYSFTNKIVDKKVDNVYDSEKTEYIYNQALKLYPKAESIDDYNFVLNQLKLIQGYKDSNKFYDECKNKIKEEEYKEACQISQYDNVSDLKRAIEKFNTIIDYKDSQDRINEIEDKIESIKKKEKEIKNKKRKKILTIVVSSVTSAALIVTICLLTFLVFIPKAKWNKIEKLVEQNELVSFSSTKNSIYFGSYPQTRVTDNTLTSTLLSKASTILYNWTNYEYYIDGEVEGYMYYKDIELDGSKYRGVYYNQYRPYDTGLTSSLIAINNSYQDDNGYRAGRVYWFKYEPIKWDILKIEDSKILIISDLILDSQDYNYTAELRNEAVDYQGNTTTSIVLCNNYMYSHIRNWLNEAFYETSFSILEKQIIETTIVDNSAKSTGDSSNFYVCDNTSDKIFLLSYKETKKYYSSDSKRQAQGSDYAKSQGLYVSIDSSYSGCFYYWLRSPYDGSGHCARYVSDDGYIGSSDVYKTYYGVRPVCWICL